MPSYRIVQFSTGEYATQRKLCGLWFFVSPNNNIYCSAEYINAVCTFSTKSEAVDALSKIIRASRIPKIDKIVEER